MECTPLEAWSLFTSISLHFKEDNSYDAFKYNFKGPRCTRQSFMVRSDRWKYEKLVREYHRKEDLINYFVANVIHGARWIGQCNESTALEWTAKMQRLDYTFKNDMEIIAKHENNFDHCIIPKDRNEIPCIYKLHQAGEISLETLTILEYLCAFTKDLDKYLFDPLCSSSDLSNYIRQYMPFVRNFISDGGTKYTQTIKSLFTH